MTDAQKKCVVILSTKSSGSSAIQRLLNHSSRTSLVQHTRHKENETLYWTKAASILGRPQIKMLDSEVPIPAVRARRELEAFIRKNTGVQELSKDPEELIYTGWEALCEKYRPVFLEKSPHHLVQWSAIELLLECDRRLGSTRFLFIGLIRNPMDVLYSMWSRWRTVPEQGQYEWELAYQNLERLHQRLKERLLIVRYEDIIKDIDRLRPVIRFIGGDDNEVPHDFLHARAISKWKADKHYGFELAPSVRSLANQYGYADQDLDNPHAGDWHAHRVRAQRAYRLGRIMRSPVRLLRGLRWSLNA